MARGFDSNQQRKEALNALGKELARRAKSKCELTGAAGVPLRPYEIPPVPADPDPDRILLLSEACHAALARPAAIDCREWRCLGEAVWSDFPALQVVAWRLLNQLAKRDDWAREALAAVELEPEVEEWALKD
jgi:protein PhnA